MLWACKEPPPAPSVADASPAVVAPVAVADAGAAADGGAKKPRIERPVPKDVTVVRMDMPEDVQMKASQYMAAMRAPNDDDPAADPTYAEDLRKKLDGLSRAMDRGSDKATMNSSAVMAGARQIDLLMSEGCQPDTPKKLTVQRAGVQLNMAYMHGVLVIRCNDKKLQCLQSTRDPDDVLCTSAPRKNKPSLPGAPPKK
jgi:hypothetical protein